MSCSLLQTSERLTEAWPARAVCGVRCSDGPEVLKALADGSHPFAAKLKGAKNPMIVVGMGALCRADGGAVFAASEALAKQYNAIRPADGWNGLAVLHTAASQPTALDVGFVPGPDAATAPKRESSLEPPACLLV
jgi:NADH-quinone oxidoreductase subunit G